MTPKKSRYLRIRDLPTKCREPDLRAAFERYAGFQNVRLVVKDSQPRQAIISFADVKSASNAISAASAQQDFKVSNYLLKLDYYEPLGLAAQPNSTSNDAHHLISTTGNTTNSNNTHSPGLGITPKKSDYAIHVLNNSSSNGSASLNYHHHHNHVNTNNSTPSTCPDPSSPLFQSSMSILDEQQHRSPTNDSWHRKLSSSSTNSSSSTSPSVSVRPATNGRPLSRLSLRLRGLPSSSLVSQRLPAALSSYGRVKQVLPSTASSSSSCLVYFRSDAEVERAWRDLGRSVNPVTGQARTLLLHHSVLVELVQPSGFDPAPTTATAGAKHRQTKSSTLSTSSSSSATPPSTTNNSSTSSFLDPARRPGFLTDPCHRSNKAVTRTLYVSWPAHLIPPNKPPIDVQTLSKAFSRFGELCEIELTTNKHNSSKVGGGAFLQFTESSFAARSMHAHAKQPLMMRSLPLTVSYVPSRPSKAAVWLTADPVHMLLVGAKRELDLFSLVRAFVSIQEILFIVHTEDSDRVANADGSQRPSSASLPRLVHVYIRLMSMSDAGKLLKALRFDGLLDSLMLHRPSSSLVVDFPGPKQVATLKRLQLDSKRSSETVNGSVRRWTCSSSRLRASCLATVRPSNGLPNSVSPHCKRPSSMKFSTNSTPTPSSGQPELNKPPRSNSHRPTPTPNRNLSNNGSPKNGCSSSSSDTDSTVSSVSSASTSPSTSSSANSSPRGLDKPAPSDKVMNSLVSPLHFTSLPGGDSTAELCSPSCLSTQSEQQQQMCLSFDSHNLSDLDDHHHLKTPLSAPPRRFTNSHFDGWPRSPVLYESMYDKIKRRTNKEAEDRRQRQSESAAIRQRKRAMKQASKRQADKLRQHCDSPARSSSGTEGSRTVGTLDSGGSRSRSSSQRRNRRSHDCNGALSTNGGKTWSIATNNTMNSSTASSTFGGGLQSSQLQRLPRRSSLSSSDLDNDEDSPPETVTRLSLGMSFSVSANYHKCVRPATGVDNHSNTHKLLDRDDDAYMSQISSSSLSCSTNSSSATRRSRQSKSTKKSATDVFRRSPITKSPETRFSPLENNKSMMTPIVHLTDLPFHDPKALARFTQKRKHSRGVETSPLSVKSRPFKKQKRSAGTDSPRVPVKSDVSSRHRQRMLSASSTEESSSLAPSVTISSKAVAPNWLLKSAGDLDSDAESRSSEATQPMELSEFVIDPPLPLTDNLHSKFSSSSVSDSNNSYNEADDEWQSRSSVTLSSPHHSAASRSVVNQSMSVVDDVKKEDEEPEEEEEAILNPTDPDPVKVDLFSDFNNDTNDINVTPASPSKTPLCIVVDEDNKRISEDCNVQPSAPLVDVKASISPISSMACKSDDAVSLSEHKPQLPDLSSKSTVDTICLAGDTVLSPTSSPCRATFDSMISAIMTDPFPVLLKSPPLSGSQLFSDSLKTFDSFVASCDLSQKHQPSSVFSHHSHAIIRPAAIVPAVARVPNIAQQPRSSLEEAAKLRVLSPPSATGQYLPPLKPLLPGMRISTESQDCERYVKSVIERVKAEKVEEIHHHLSTAATSTSTNTVSSPPVTIVSSSASSTPVTSALSNSRRTSVMSTLPSSTISCSSPPVQAAIQRRPLLVTSASAVSSTTPAVASSLASPQPTVTTTDIAVPSCFQMPLIPGVNACAPVAISTITTPSVPTPAPPQGRVTRQSVAALVAAKSNTSVTRRQESATSGRNRRRSEGKSTATSVATTTATTTAAVLSPTITSVTASINHTDESSLPDSNSTVVSPRQSRRLATSSVAAVVMGNTSAKSLLASSNVTAVVDPYEPNFDDDDDSTPLEMSHPAPSVTLAHKLASANGPVIFNQSTSPIRSSSSSCCSPHLRKTPTSSTLILTSSSSINSPSSTPSCPTSPVVNSSSTSSISMVASAAFSSSTPTTSSSSLTVQTSPVLFTSAAPISKCAPAVSNTVVIDSPAIVAPPVSVSSTPLNVTPLTCVVTSTPPPPSQPSSKPIVERITVPSSVDQIIRDVSSGQFDVQSYYKSYRQQDQSTLVSPSIGGLPSQLLSTLTGEPLVAAVTIPSKKSVVASRVNNTPVSGAPNACQQQQQQFSSANGRAAAVPESMTTNTGNALLNTLLAALQLIPGSQVTVTGTGSSTGASGVPAGTAISATTITLPVVAARQAAANIKAVLTASVNPSQANVDSVRQQMPRPAPNPVAKSQQQPMSAAPVAVVTTTAALSQPSVCLPSAGVVTNAPPSYHYAATRIAQTPPVSSSKQQRRSAVNAPLRPPATTLAHQALPADAQRLVHAAQQRQRLITSPSPAATRFALPSQQPPLRPPSQQQQLKLPPVNAAAASQLQQILESLPAEQQARIFTSLISNPGEAAAATNQLLAEYVKRLSDVNQTPVKSSPRSQPSPIVDQLIKVGSSPMGAVAVDQRQLGSPAAAAARFPTGNFMPPPPAPTALPPPPQSVVPNFLTSSHLSQHYPLFWDGRLSLKNVEAHVALHFVDGNALLLQTCVKLLASGGGGRPQESLATGGPLKIVQRMRLEPVQLDGVARKMRARDDACLCLALPTGPDVARQSGVLRDSFIRYMLDKQAAGIINVFHHPSEQQGLFVIHIFPPCEFANGHLQAAAPSLYQHFAQTNQPHLLFVITTV